MSHYHATGPEVRAEVRHHPAIIRILHCVSQDQQGHDLGFFGYDSSFEYRKVFFYKLAALLTDDEICEYSYEQLNIGAGNTVIAHEYRAAGLRSLSVGDVIGIDDGSRAVRWYAVERVGFKKVEQPAHIVP